jgi:2-polyprenyl-3-methyl-5-hydroxy-6-metoxy-1,4-benzoquinol methylase
VKYLDRVLQRWRIQAVLPYIKSSDRVLDVGAGSGELFSHLSQCREYVGVDPTVQTEQILGPNAKLLPGAFPDTLTTRGQFDVVCVLAVFEHVPVAEKDAFAHACARSLVPSGLLLVTVPSRFVDYVLIVLRSVRLLDGMSLEEHHGFDHRLTPAIFGGASFSLIEHRRFELGLNHLFVFRRDGGRRGASL